jgi:hypothetical protein
MLCITTVTGHAADIFIVSPRNQETIQDNSGNVTVKLDARVGGRERIRLLLDGKPFGPDSDQTAIELQDLERGEHSLQALLLDESDKIVAASGPVTFHVWRASAQFPARKPPSSGPPTSPPPSAPAPSHPIKKPAR